MGDRTTNNQQDSLERLFLAEYQHMAESFLDNEELGERRVNFFITLTAAVPTALIAILRNEISLKNGTVSPIFFIGLVALLLFGVSTLVRVIRRNLQTDKYLQALAAIRKYFVAEDNVEALKYLRFNPYGEEPRHERHKIFSLGTGGLVEMAALINCLIIVALYELLVISLFSPGIYLIHKAFQFLIFAGFGVFFLISAWAVQMLYVMRRYEKRR
jgi:hypothetical protein